MVSIKEATQNTIAFAEEVLDRDRARGLRLEEVESTSVEGEDAWIITLSMIIPDEVSTALGLGPLLPGTGKREYKSFTVLKSNGEVKSMKIRELADV